MLALPFSLLPAGFLVRRARRLYAAGKASDALKVTDAALAKLLRGSPKSKATGSVPGLLEDATYLRGKILLERADESGALNAFLAAYPAGRLDADAFSLLVRGLLQRGDLGTQARAIYFDYISRVPIPDPAPIFRRNLDRLGTISAPDVRDPEGWKFLRAWNEALVAKRDDVPWVHRHLGTLAALRGDWATAARELWQTLDLDPHCRKSRSIRAYALMQQERFGTARSHLNRLVNQMPTRKALVLRGHCLRRRGEPRAAASDLRAAHRHRPLTQADALAFAETLINAEEWVAARELIEHFSSPQDERWDLLLGAIAETEGRPDKALKIYQGLTRSQTLGGQTVRRLLAALAENPQVKDALVLLESVPQEHRGDLYWTTRGNVCLAADNTRDALEAWSQVSAPGPALVAAFLDLFRWYLVSLYNTGDYDGVLATAARYDMTRSGMDSSALIPVIASALGRHIQGRLENGTATLDEFNIQVKQIAAKVAGFGTHPKTRLMSGLLHAHVGQYRQGHDILKPFWQSGQVNREILLQLVRCALRSEYTKTARQILETLDHQDPDVRRLAAADAALAGHWNAALDYLTGTGDLPLPASIHCALLFQAGRFEALAKLAGEGHHHHYYLAASRLHRKRQTEAEQSLRAIPDTDGLRPAADRLLGWIRLQEARDALASGKQRPAFEKLAEALTLWPDQGGPMTDVEGDESSLLPVFVAVNERTKILAVLRDRADAAGLAEPASCHRLALYYLAEGERSAKAGEFADALRNWEWSVACICVTLANFTYIQEWAEERSRTYGVHTTAENIVGIESKVLGRLEGLFHSWTERLAGRGRREKADRLSDLVLSLNTELAAAKLLREREGFTVEGNPGRVSAGPTYLALMDLEIAFGSHLDSLKLKGTGRRHLPEEEGDLTRLLRMMAELIEQEDDGMDPAVKRNLEWFFSSLRFAAFLEHSGEPEQALQRLRTRQPRCLPLGTGRSCTGMLRQACSQDLPCFAKCNPAFSGPDGGEKFRAAAEELEESVLFTLGEQAIAAPEDRSDQAVRYWSDAGSLAASSGRDGGLRARMRKAILGRVQVLQQKDRMEDGIRLIEAMDSLCGNEELQGMLATLHAAVAITVINEDDDWEQGVKGLRRARGLNPHSSHINLNLILALRGWANETHERDWEQACGLLEEAIEIAKGELETDPHNKQLQELANTSRAELAALRPLDDTGSVEDLLTAMLMKSTGGPQGLSTLYHNQGVAKANEGKFDEAITDLEKALELEPDSDVTRKMLAQTLNARAVERANAERFDSALQDIRRGLKLAPGDAVLKGNRDAISKARRFAKY